MDKVYKDCIFPTADARLTDTVHVKGEAQTERKADRAICADGRVSVTKVTASDGKADVDGKLYFNCICEAEDKSLFSFCGSADFSHTLECDDIDDESNPRVYAQLSDITIAVKDERIVINADIDLFCRVENNRKVKMLCESEGVEVFQRTALNMERECVGDTTSFVREEIVTGKTDKVIYADATVCIRDITAVVDTARVDGILNLNALCYSKESGYLHLRQNIPFSVDVETKYDNCKNLSGMCEVSDVRLRIQEDEYGIAELDAQIHVRLFSATQAPLCLCTDAYAPQEPFACVKKDLQLLLFRNTAEQKTALKAVIHTDNMQEYSEGIFCMARPYISSAEKTDGEVTTDGIIAATLIYRNKSGEIMTSKDIIPFTVKIPVSFENVEIDAHSVCTSLSIGAPSDKGVEISISLSTTASLYELSDIMIVTDTAPCSKKEAKSGFIICFAGEGETAYDIAKEFCISKKSLQESNPNLGETLKEGDKAILLR